MPSAREIRARLRKREDDERRRREDAVVVAAETAAVAVKARVDNDAALREAFEVALKTGGDAARGAALREMFEEALADSPRVIEAELAAGHAVLAAAAVRVTQVELAELTEQRVEDLRRWALMAKRDRPDAGSVRGGARGEGAGRTPAARAATGFAVVCQPEADATRDGAVADDVATAG